MTTDGTARGPVHDALALLARISGLVVVVGSLNADLTVPVATLPRPGETVPGGELQVLPGGKSANQAAAAARTGATVRLVGAVGRDAHGDLLLDALAGAGVGTSAVARVGTATGTAVILHDDAGENVIVVSPGANGRVDVALVDAARESFTSAGAVGLCLEIGVPAVARAAALARQAGATSVLNVSPLPARIPGDLLRAVDVLVVNEHELAAVVAPGATGADGAPAGTAEAAAAGVEADPADALVELTRRYGVGRAVVTLGARGAVVREDGTSTVVPAVGVDAVDTTGAGDAFTGALLAGLASGLTLVASARLATLVAATSTMRVGAQASYVDAAELVRTWTDRQG